MGTVRAKVQFKNVVQVSECFIFLLFFTTIYGEWNFISAIIKQRANSIMFSS